jgi:hypothetical protein
LDATDTVRWSGYFGATYVDPSKPRARFLFVGANHKAGPKGLAKTPKMGLYNAILRAWALQKRSEDSDAMLLREMRKTYEKSWLEWGAVWRNFTKIRAAIRKTLGIRLEERDDAFAFINLARCPCPGELLDNDVIPACQRSFPLANLVETIDARVIFLAKGGNVGNDVIIPGERSKERYVVRYASGSRGQRPGARHYTHWLQDEVNNISEFITGNGGGL